MGEQNKQGNFCWTELGTHKIEAAKDYYTKLLGWQYSEMPSPEGGTYTMAKVSGKEVLGVFDMSAKPETQNLPSHFMPYIWVDDIKATTSKVEGLGGKVMMGPVEIPGFGRFSVIQDPQGAVVSLWNSDRNEKPDLDVFTQGVPSWFELMTHDIEGAKKFYGELIGWKMKVEQMGTPEQPMDYVLIGDGGEKSDGGMMQMPPGMENVPSNWGVYMTVENYEASAKKVTELGGNIAGPQMDIPTVGIFSAVSDPEGTICTIIQYHPQN